MTSIQFEQSPLGVDDLLQGDVKLVSPPETYSRLRQLMAQPGSSMGAIAAVIGKDPALTARLLRVANSVFFALPRKVHSVQEAVQMLGLREISQLVLATDVIQRFHSIPRDLIDIYAFWHHSLRCAVLARLLASHRTPRGDEEPLFIAGLLHGIGHLVMYTRIPELARKALVESRHRGMRLHEAERKVMGFDYADVGAALARRWDLPELLCTVLAFQNRAQGAETYRAEAALVQLACAASRARSFDPETLKAAASPDLALWQAARLTPEVMDAILPEAEATFSAALALVP